jgi:pantoate--beta-alanine ligase
MNVTHTVTETRAAVAQLARPVGLVPTMGAFHDGHLALIGAARERCASVVVSLFVNPTQFGEDNDYRSYPRDESHDLALADETGVDLLFAPTPAEMYRNGAATLVHVDGPLTSSFEGAERPGHFDGVATVVTKLFTIATPDGAFFGRKDAQQLALVRRLTADLDFAVEIVAVETVREADGLAMSSRNAHLSEKDRAKAPDLYRSLRAGRAVVTDGVRAVVDQVTGKLVVGFGPRLQEVPVEGDTGPLFSVDYVAVVDPETFEKVADITPRSLIIAAVRLHETRLIDNLPIGEPPYDNEKEAAT